MGNLTSKTFLLLITNDRGARRDAWPPRACGARHVCGDRAQCVHDAPLFHGYQICDARALFCDALQLLHNDALLFRDDRVS